MPAHLTSPGVQFAIRVDHSTRQVAIAGEFDMATATNLATTIAALQRAANGDITIDVAELSFIDAAGLGAVAMAHSVQADRGARLVVTGTSPHVRQTFLLGNLADLLDADDGQL